MFEDRLPLALRKIEELTTEAEARAAERERAARERQRAWESAMDQAKQQWREDRLVASLDDQLTRRKRRMEIEALIKELRAAHEPPSGSDADEWIGWMSRYARSIDPRRDQIGMPQIPEPSVSDLQQLLGRRWSVIGP
jgi:hypothetical protein